MTIPNRTVTIAGVFAENALTTIPQTPSAGTSYRDTTLTAADAKAGWAYKTIVDSAKFNQAQYQYSSIASQIEKYGFLPWSNLTDYVAGSLCLGSNGTIYRAKQNTGPSSTVKDPTTDSALTYWENFVGEEYIDYSRLSNCILKIPQSINMELSSDGTLTLKSGSVLTKPDGTQLTTTADRTTTASTNGTYIVLPTGAGGAIGAYPVSDFCSGSTDSLSGVANHIWFDTTNLVINKYGSDGTTLSWEGCFPVAVVTVSNGAISSIDKVFNGAGYIGHHAFILPGISFLRADGKNTDGTLTSTKYTRNTVFIIELVSSQKCISIFNAGNGVELLEDYITVPTYNDLITDYSYVGRTLQYVVDDNMSYRMASSSPHAFSATRRTLFVRYSYDGTSVTRFDIEPVVRIATQEDLDKKQDEATALNYNHISNCITGIPQDIKVELVTGGFTLKAGTIYYMPDGTAKKTTSDITKTTAVGGGAGFSVVCINAAGTTLRYRNIVACVSGAGVTTVGGFAYNTTTNKVEFYDATGTKTNDDNSFPLMILETDSSGMTKSVYKLFNGVGYIGHHAFVLPGISFLLGNGKNADGTLSSYTYTKTNLTVIELDTTRKAITMINSTGAERNTDFITVKTYNDLSTNIGQTVQYVIDENKSYRLTASTPHVIVEANRTLLVRVNYDGTSVTQFDVDPVIRLDDKASIGGNNDFLGTNTVPTPATTDNSKKIANTEFVKAAIAANGAAPRDVTTLWSDPSGKTSGTITLSEAFTNFEKIGVYFAKDNLNEVTVYVQDTYWLNRVLTNSSHSVLIAQLGDASWSIANYGASTPSTTTKFVETHESGVLFYVYGINRISS